MLPIILPKRVLYNAKNVMKKNKNIQQALVWWNSLPIQSIEVNPASHAYYCMKHYPDKTDCNNLNDDEIYYIWEQQD